MPGIDLNLMERIMLFSQYKRHDCIQLSSAIHMISFSSPLGSILSILFVWQLSIIVGFGYYSRNILPSATSSCLALTFFGIFFLASEAWWPPHEPIVLHKSQTISRTSPRPSITENLLWSAPRMSVETVWDRASTLLFKICKES